MRYTREDGCRAWLTYGLLPLRLLRELLDEYGSAEAVYDEFRRTGGAFLEEFASAESVRLLREQAEPDAMHRMMLTMQRLDVGVMHSSDRAYPELLRQIASPPGLLFYRGSLECLQERMLTIVGTRHASPQGLDTARTVARDLSRAGVVIVSGLAEGIDGAAHEGCLEGGAPTVGLCASGIDVDYPAGNHALKERIIAGGGLLLSEFPLGLPAFRQNFHIRNRLLSGISRGVVMIESRIKSGTMVTVQYALDQGRDVFAWPGVPGSEYAEGAHQLLREGARFFTTADDLLEDMGWHDAPTPTREEKAALPPLSPDQQTVMQALRVGEQSMDQLAAVTGLETSTLSTALTLLQIMGLVRAMPGKTYRII